MRFTWTKDLVSFLKDVFHEFSADQGSLFAAAISFFGIISLIPLLLTAVGLLGFVMGNERALQSVVEFIRSYVPVGFQAVESYLARLSDQSGVLSGLGVLGLLWAGSQVFVIIQQVMNIALGSERRLGFFKSRAVALIMVVAAGLLFGFSISLSWLFGFLLHRQPFNLFEGDLALRFFGVLLTIVISSMAFVLMYHFVPLKDVGFRGPLVGGITAGLLFEVAKYGFRWYVTNIADFSSIYGPFSVAVVLVLWIYYVSLIAVFGAEIASVYARREGHGESSQ
ncbi:MAG: YihY/virulence factor BrkB family protein [Armatimonadota bacterium]